MLVDNYYQSAAKLHIDIDVMISTVLNFIYTCAIHWCNKKLYFSIYCQFTNITDSVNIESQQCKKLSPINKEQDTRYKIQDTDEIVMIK